ncbi:DUF2007 domain-containing protein [Parvibaculum sp.]|uniref:putative signal transducing protein n=1 Tax=Parvibaculum sp. TaxID=2024848 RepID=UPI00320FF889
MEELIRTNDIVLISYLEHRLREAGIEPLVLDAHMSIVEGSLGVLPRRIMVAPEDLEAARRILDDVGEGV